MTPQADTQRETRLPAWVAALASRWPTWLAIALAALAVDLELARYRPRHSSRRLRRRLRRKWDGGSRFDEGCS